MMSAPGSGSVLPRRESNASAGGQLEQPSEVNNSTRTGVGGEPAGAGLAEPYFILAAAEPVMPALKAIRPMTATAAINSVANFDWRLIRLPFDDTSCASCTNCITEFVACWMSEPRIGSNGDAEIRVG